VKITISSSKKITLTNKPFEPIQVETSIIIENEVDEDWDDYEAMQNKLSNLLDKDLEKKAKETFVVQEKVRNEIKNLKVV